MVWQCFLFIGLLVLLLLVDGCCLIVWLLFEDEVVCVLVLDEVVFCDVVGVVSDFCLGWVIGIGVCVVFLLQLKLVECYDVECLVLFGDVVYVVYLLVGQGVNLGLCDVIELCDMLVIVCD